ncbi:hypothetical protein SpiGrapes_2022 [Sphaerochaeta pleomorpha str. Grapes]|uniref:DUF3842 domain-containing protein n=1 Tax=Sphaerochaeta pleomorpha (strain ATCC BAA-1885 / DSM 22778 / Grapes) TaxID=158190 RepID=G8QQG4_SPHPG|nr:DUF3842 family protein [Sphaerochaeta pleomorpha]AEV29809.1 hypothetical protein SpiGrapes_2022 [Sphaerochaeta pleomorpha str. Grapes]
MKKTVKTVIIDGQGGSLGKALVTSIKTRFPNLEVLAIGTNSMAASAMLRSGADATATGENPVIVACRTADIIIGPLGIIAADSLHGEITPKMALAISQSTAHKILIPISKCNITIVGKQDFPLGDLVDKAIENLAELLETL